MIKSRVLPSSVPRNTVGVGTVILPWNADRAEYIQNCYRNGTVTILDESSLMCEATICTHVLQDINFRFPEKKEDLGSQVLYVNHWVDNRPLITGLFLNQNEVIPLPNEHSFQKDIIFKDNLISISGNGETSTLTVRVKGDTSLLKFNIDNQKNEGKLQINVQGDTELVSRNLNVSSEEKNTVLSTDGNYLGYREVDTVEHDYEPILLGNTSTQFLKDLIQQIQQILSQIQLLTVPTVLGPSGVPLNNPSFQQISQTLQNMIDDNKLGGFDSTLASKISFTE